MKIQKKIRRSACIFTAGMMILSAGAVFTGCADKKENTDGGNNGNSITASDEETTKTLTYTVNDIEMSEDFYRLTGRNGLLYTVSYEYTKQGEAWYSKQSICVMDETGKIQMKIPVFEQTEDNQFCTVYNNFIFDGSNITCIIYSGTSDPVTYSSEGTYQLLTFDSEGNQISAVEIDPILTSEDNEKGRYLNEFITDSDGNIYCNLGTCVRVLDKTGKLLFTTDDVGNNNGYMRSLILTNSGVPAVCIEQWGEEPVCKLVEIDINAQKFGTEHILPDEYINNVYSGSGDYLCYVPNDTGIAGYRADILEKESVLSLLDLGIDTAQLDVFIPCEDGSFITGGWSYSGAMSNMAYSYIKPADSSQIKEKQLITLGCFSMDQFWRSAVANFNRTNEDYTISAVSYSDNNDITDYDAALTKFNNDLLAGNTPDILLMYNQRSFDSYTKKGLLTDLYPLIDNDPDLNRDSFLPNILAAMETDGKLYKIPVSFSISAYAAKTALVGDAKNITLSEAAELVDKLSEGAVLANDTYTQKDFLLIALWYSNFIDYENGTCNFDSPEFKEILETAKTYPAEMDYNGIDYSERELAVKNDKALLYNTYLHNFDSYYQAKSLVGEDITLMGFPNSEGTNGSVSIDTTIAVSERSQSKEGAWEFIKSTLEDLVSENEYEIYNPYAEEGAEPVTEMRWDMNRLHMGFPVLVSDLENLAMQSTVPWKTFNEDGEMVPQENTYSINDIKIKMEPLTAGDAQRLIDYIMSVDNFYKYDINIDSIIDEETSSFFAGAKSADETAQIIQSRVSIYMSEQYR